MVFGKNDLIPRRNLRCSKCDELFSVKLEYVTHLFQDEKDKWLRKDYCTACWDPSEDGHFWKGKIEPKKEKDNSKLLDVFRELAQETRLDAEQTKRLYLITLCLERKREIAKRSASGLYEILHTGEVFLIKQCFIPVDEAQQIFENHLGKICS